MAQDFLRYLASRPKDWREAVYRIVVIVLLIWGAIRLERVRQGQQVTQTELRDLGMVVATAAVPPAPTSQLQPATATASTIS